MRLLKDMGRFEHTETALPWVYRVATNHCLNVLRDRSRRREEELGEWDVSDPGAAATYPERRLAQTVLSSFDEGTQAVAVAVLVDGMGHDEIAGVLGVSRKTVERRLSKFLVRSRELVGGVS